MRSTVRRAVRAASVVAVLGLAAACSSDGGGDDEGGTKPSKSAAAQGDQKPSAQAVLERAALTKKDVPGYKIDEGAGRDARGARGGAVRPDVCRPLAGAFAPVPPSGATAHVDRVVTGTDLKDATSTRVRLSSYEGTGAKKAMADLRTALKSKKCVTFWDGGERSFGLRAQAAPGKGDETVAYKLASRKGTFLVRKNVTVVRSGSTLVAFTAENFHEPEVAGEDGVADEASRAEPEPPAAVVDAQLAKVAK
ncbi:hypothetical protein ACQB60_35515 [Actinomycetota bacterium Odt1-20B]